MCKFVAVYVILVCVTSLDANTEDTRNIFDLNSKCGNGVIDDGEECDCFHFDFKCYDCCKSDCTLHVGAVCSFGECCKECQVVAENKHTVCRITKNDCDFAEFCDGVHANCPNDGFERNGTECINGMIPGYCFNGLCNTKESQCRQLFDRTARHTGCESGDNKNVRGDTYGNCGTIDFDNSIYRKCLAEDRMCGKLHCSWEPTTRHNRNWIKTKLNKIGLFKYGAFSVYENETDKFPCYGINFKGSTDYGLTADGTKCGDEKVCYHQKCIHISTIQSQSHQFRQNRKIFLILLSVFVLVALSLVMLVAFGSFYVSSGKSVHDGLAVYYERQSETLKHADPQRNNLSTNLSINQENVYESTP